MDYTREERAYIGALELLAGMRFHEWYGCTIAPSNHLVGDAGLDREINGFLTRLV